MSPRRPRKVTDLPDWLRDLRGYDDVAPQLPDMDTLPSTPAAGEPWEIHYRLDADLDAVLEQVDPLVLLASMAYASARLEDGIGRMVRLCRSHGASWTQIGEILDMTKQSAWARYSNED
jgi:hypothetical protein